MYYQINGFYINKLKIFGEHLQTALYKLVFRSSPNLPQVYNDASMKFCLFTHTHLMTEIFVNNEMNDIFQLSENKQFPLTQFRQFLCELSHTRVLFIWREFSLLIDSKGIIRPNLNIRNITGRVNGVFTEGPKNLSFYI